MKTCQIKKALYGLKQALHAWFEKFPIVVISYLGFQPVMHDSIFHI